MHRSKLSALPCALVLSLVLSMSLVASAAGAAGSPGPVATDAVKGPRQSILVKVDPGADPDAVAARNGMAVVRYLPAIRWAEMVPLASGGAAMQKRSVDGATVRTDAGRGELHALGEAVAGDPAVRSVDTVPDGTGLEWQLVPSDPIFDPTLRLPPEVAPASPQAAWQWTLANFTIAWDSARGAGVNVAVIDGEFDTNNPDLRDKLVNRYNVSSGTVAYHTPNVNPEPGDQAHGSHVAGLVGASTNNGLGVAGACFECGVVAIKVSFAGNRGAQTIADVAEGIIYAADSGARVLNMSLGGPQTSQAQLDAINYALSRNVVVVASGGNDHEKGDPVNYPSAYPNVIGVGATDATDQIGSFSSQGPWIDVSAPGKEVLSTSSEVDEFPLSLGESGGLPIIVSVKDGTSMAAPIVAGLAALMISVRPDLTPAEVEALMKSSAKDLGIAGPDIIYGAGRIDAAAAVAAAAAYVRPAPPAPPAPPTPAPRAKKPVRKIDSKVRLRVKVRRGKVSYLGSVGSKNKRCLKKRQVFLRAKRSNKALVSSRTTKRGGFRLGLKKRPKKRVQVVVKAKKLGPRVVCKGAQSKFVN